MTPTAHSLSLADISKLLDATVQGDGAMQITGIAPLQSATASQISFLENPRYKKFLADTQAGAVLLREEDLAACQTAALVVKDPYAAYAKLSSHFEKRPSWPPGIHPTAIISPEACIDDTAHIGPHVVIEAGARIAKHCVIQTSSVIGANTTVGEQTLVWPRVTLYHGVQLGARCELHSGVVIGADGFGIAHADGRWHKISQLGRVIIGDDVEIGANTTIDRGALEDTLIGQGVKIDNQVMIGHNVQIGAHTAIAGCVGICGSAKIGQYCLIGGGAGIGGHLTIADGVHITGMAMVTNSVDTPGLYSSNVPLQDNRSWRRNVARFKQLDKLARGFKQLENTVQALLNGKAS